MPPVKAPTNPPVSDAPDTLEPVTVIEEELIVPPVKLATNPPTVALPVTEPVLVSAPDIVPVDIEPNRPPVLLPLLAEIVPALLSAPLRVRLPRLLMAPMIPPTPVEAALAVTLPELVKFKL